MILLREYRPTTGHFLAAAANRAMLIHESRGVWMAFTAMLVVAGGLWGNFFVQLGL